MNAAQKKAARDAADAAEKAAKKQPVVPPTNVEAADKADSTETHNAAAEAIAQQAIPAALSENDDLDDDDLDDDIEDEDDEDDEDDDFEDDDEDRDVLLEEPIRPAAAPAHQAPWPSRADAATGALGGMPANSPLAAAFRQGDEEAAIARIAALNLEIAELDLETKKILLEQTRDSNKNYVQTKERKFISAERAQKILNSAMWNQKQTENGCAHATGGFGLEDLYDGNKEPSIVAMELPVAGRRAYLCFRCLKLVQTPDPHLRETDVEKWLEDTADFKEFTKLFRRSLARVMGGPAFVFSEHGRPIDPKIV